jgi:hypothetical protein
MQGNAHACRVLINTYNRVMCVTQVRKCTRFVSFLQGWASEAVSRGEDEAIRQLRVEARTIKAAVKFSRRGRVRSRQ